MKKLFSLYLILSFCFSVYGKKPEIPLYKNPLVPTEDRVKDLLSRMTVEEKVWQLYQHFIGKNDNINNIADRMDDIPAETAVGASADFYMMTAPFTLSAGETFKVTIETTTGTQEVAKTAPQDIEFKAGTYNTASIVYDFVPDYADHLYQETFYDSTHRLPTSGNNATSFNGMASRWTNYLKDLSGLSVYDGVISAITYAWTNTQPSAQESTALEGMDGNHLWFQDVNSTFTVSGIRLYGKTKLNLSFLQTYKSSGLKIEYSLNGGTSWTEIGTVTNPASAACESRSFDFEVASDSRTIDLRFTCTVKGPRIDNIKLTWQAE